MAKVAPKYEMEDYLLPDEGLNVFSVFEVPAVNKERKDRVTGAGKPGWEYKLTFAQDGGGADGAKHFESFYTRQNDGKENVFGASILFGILVKLGIYKADYEFDTDVLETDGFAKNWPKLLGKKVGIQIEHKAQKKDPKKFMSVAKKWLTLNEARTEMAKKGTVGIKNDPPAAPVSEGWDD
jgi:hypothetical protein